MLPKYDEKTTYGILVTNERNIIPLKSPNVDPAYKNYASAGHVEGKAAIWMRQHDSSGGVVFHNNTNGTCGYCNSHLETLLPEAIKLWVFPPEGAVPKDPSWIAEPKEYNGNANPPKTPQIK